MSAFSNFEYRDVWRKEKKLVLWQKESYRPMAHDNRGPQWQRCRSVLKGRFDLGQICWPRWMQFQKEGNSIGESRGGWPRPPRFKVFHFHTVCTSGSKIWSRGPPINFFWDFADVAKWSWASEWVSLKYAFSHFSWYFFFKNLLLFAYTFLCKPGVWGPLRAPEAVILLTVKYAFSHFSWYFFFKNLT